MAKNKNQKLKNIFKKIAKISLTLTINAEYLCVNNSNDDQNESARDGADS